MNTADVIGVDWGSTNFRAWAFGRNGEVLAEKTAPIGLKTVGDAGGFESAFLDQCGDWLVSASNVPVLFCGMVGARGGWHEAPYAACPVRPRGLIDQAVRFTIAGHPAAILPGATCRTATGVADVMRGEEIQILGAAESLGLTEARFCMPGTHCKWARLLGGELTGFATYITGELFQLLRHHSLLGRLAEGDNQVESAFRRGLERGAAIALSHALFAARAEVLTGGLEPGAVSAFLSGMLIGAEIAAEPKDNMPLILLASGVHAERYAVALDSFGRSYRAIDADEATRAGLVLAAAAIHRHVDFAK